jgi:hypothetical protein
MKAKFVFVLLALICGLANESSAQEPTRHLGRLVQVLEKRSYNPIDNAELFDPLLSQYITTNGQGAANLEFTGRIGPNKFIVRKFGYKAETIIYFGVGADTPDTLVTILLEKVTALPEVVTVGSNHQNFDIRTRNGFGKFLTPEELKNPKYNDMSVKDAIRFMNYRSLNRGTDSCRPRVSLNGGISAANVSIDGDMIRQYKAVEYYATPVGVPEEFKKPYENCGVIIFWTYTP